MVKRGRFRIAVLFSVAAVFFFESAAVYPLQFLRPKVAVLEIVHDPTISDLESASVKKSFLTHFDRSKRLSLLSQQDVFRILNSANAADDREKEVTGAAQEQYANFERMFEEGKELYLNSRFQEAVDRFREALGELSNALIVVTDNKRWLEILIYLAVCYHFLGDEKNAATAFKNALFLNPAYHPDVTQFPPEIVRLFDQQRLSFVKQSRYTVTIELKPSYADLLLNGKAIDPALVHSGVGKVTLRGLYPGTHILVAKKQGFVSKKIDVIVKEDNQSVTLELESLESGRLNFFALLRPFPNGEDLDRNRLKLLETFGIREALDIILLAFVAKGKHGETIEIAAQLYDRRNGLLTPVIEKTVSSRLHENAVSEIVREFERYLDIDGYITLLPTRISHTSLETELEKEQRERPFYSKWWFLTMVGLGVLGGGVATYFLVLQGDDTVRFKVHRSQ